MVRARVASRRLCLPMYTKTTMADQSPKREFKEEVKQEPTEDDVLDIDTNEIVLSGSGLKDYSSARPARGARVSKSTVGASKSVREPR
jgi:hypothetical protein